MRGGATAPATAPRWVAHPYAELLSPLLSVTSDDLARGLAWCNERSDQAGAFDAVLAAAAATAGASAIVSGASAFGSDVDGVTHVAPDRGRRR